MTRDRILPDGTPAQRRVYRRWLTAMYAQKHHLAACPRLERALHRWAHVPFLMIEEAERKRGSVYRAAVFSTKWTPPQPLTRWHDDLDGVATELDRDPD